LSALARFAVTSSAKDADSTGVTLIPSSPDVVSLLAEDTALPEKNHDHGLSGIWSDHRECRLKPDLLLIYRKPDAGVLQLVRLGSHSELFG
jgi:mRNA interferase YafQ